MHGYRYTFSDLDGRVKASLTLQSSSEESARELARELLARIEVACLELRNDPERMRCISEPDATGSSTVMAEPASHLSHATIKHLEAQTPAANDEHWPAFEGRARVRSLQRW
jgi:hypothetical protein